MQTNELDVYKKSPNLSNLSNKEKGNKSRFSLVYRLVQTCPKRQTKIKTFQLWHKHETPLDDYPVNSLFCFVEDDYAVIDSLAELEKKIVMWR